MATNGGGVFIWVGCFSRKESGWTEEMSRQLCGRGGGNPKACASRKIEVNVFMDLFVCCSRSRQSRSREAGREFCCSRSTVAPFDLALLYVKTQILV